MLLSEAVQLMIAQRIAENYSPCTIYQDRVHMKKLINYLADPQLDLVTLADLRRFIAERAQNLKPATIAQHVRRIRSFFRWLVDEEHLGKSPAVKLKEPKLPKRLPKALSFEQLELLRDACRTPREHAILECLFATGCRGSELAGIQRHDVDWDRKALTVLGKGRKEREVYLSPRATLWLRRYLATRRDDHLTLFVAARGNPRPTSQHQIWYCVKKLGARCGMRQLVWPHVMRHTMATALLNRGAPLVSVQSILGHEKPETTQLYAHLSGQNRQADYQRYFPH